MEISRYLSVEKSRYFQNNYMFKNTCFIHLQQPHTNSTEPFQQYKKEKVPLSDTSAISPG